LSKWPGKYVIGLTGNIATGKSVVRKMLEHLGAYGIDADALGHRAIAKGAPGYKGVVDTFGRWVLNSEGQIDRVRLGSIVFNNPPALAALEGVIHPLVTQAVDIIVRRATQTVVVIEAIKLMESDLRSSCDSLWVTYTPPEVQLYRLMNNRKMSEAEARQRIATQPPQEKKVAAASVVIKNVRGFEDTWRQVVAAWQATLPPFTEALQGEEPPAARGELVVQRGRPANSEEIARMITRYSGSGKQVTRGDIMAAFGEKAFLLLKIDDKLVGLAGWQVENLVARTTDLYLSPEISTQQALPVLLREVEQASRALQSEVSLLFIPPELAQQRSLWKALGYEQRTPMTLGIQAWQEAAQESMPGNSVLFFKQLRNERVLRPI
jgi:dephospho-CoA kinase